MKFTCNTVGELMEALKHWPLDKPIVQDSLGDTYPLTVQDWSDEPSESLDWPVAIFDMAYTEKE
jgi:hypothetical protein